MRIVRQVKSTDAKIFAGKHPVIPADVERQLLFWGHRGLPGTLHQVKVGMQSLIHERNIRTPLLVPPSDESTW